MVASAAALPDGGWRQPRHPSALHPAARALRPVAALCRSVRSRHLPRRVGAPDRDIRSQPLAAARPCLVRDERRELRNWRADGIMKGELMKTLFFMIVAVLVLPVLADIPPSPIPLHRIGYEILVGIAGTAITGGAVLQALIKRYRDLDRDDRFRASHMCGKGYVVQTDRLRANACRIPLNDVTALRFLTDGEVVEMRRKLKKTMPALRVIFEKEYAAKSKGWLEDPSCPCAEKREIWWKEKCEELVLAVLLQDESLRQQLKGVPFEWVSSRFAVRPRLTCVERMRRIVVMLERTPGRLLELIPCILLLLLRVFRLVIVFPIYLLGCLIDACGRRRRGK